MNIVQEFHDMGCQDLKEVWLMPPQAAKRMPPLDNALFHVWKDKIRKRVPITEHNIEQLMADEWNNITAKQIKSYYHHCGLISKPNPYDDCPEPTEHAHDI
jgi:hypothetical protein